MAKCAGTKARAGLLKTPHGDVETPVFAPVGTQGSVKTLLSEDLEKLARRLGFESGPEGSAGDQFLAELDRHTTQTREIFLRLVAQEQNLESKVREVAHSG